MCHSFCAFLGKPLLFILSDLCLGWADFARVNALGAVVIFINADCGLERISACGHFPKLL